MLVSKKNSGWPVGWSPTATNAQDQVTSERGGPSPYRAVEPWLYIIIFDEEYIKRNIY
jgi:hypothetical protein